MIPKYTSIQQTINIIIYRETIQKNHKNFNNLLNHPNVF